MRHNEVSGCTRPCCAADRSPSTSDRVGVAALYGVIVVSVVLIAVMTLSIVRLGGTGDSGASGSTPAQGSGSTQSG